jgi:hypothetical protein
LIDHLKSVCQIDCRKRSTWQFGLALDHRAASECLGLTPKLPVMNDNYREVQRSASAAARSAVRCMLLLDRCSLVQAVWFGALTIRAIPTLL